MSSGLNLSHWSHLTLHTIFNILSVVIVKNIKKIIISQDKLQCENKVIRCLLQHAALCWETFAIPHVDIAFTEVSITIVALIF